MANPDRRKRRYSTLHGIYAQNCGLHNVRMSWTAYEYLYHVLNKNKVKLPKEAYFAIRYQVGSGV
jgi:inositol oxygenase